jgi:RimJ/RimL family protein N-acetyltransferase
MLSQEATRWIVGYGFEQLALHRISLEVLADNPRAVELYKYMYAARLALAVAADDAQRLRRGGHVPEDKLAGPSASTWISTAGVLTITYLQDSKWGSVHAMGILRDEWPPARSDQHADFAETSVNCNIIGTEALANLWATR